MEIQVDLSPVITSREYQKDIFQIVCIELYMLFFNYIIKYIIWPTSSERRLESLENQMRKGFTGAIGTVDGTNIVLLYKPGGDLIGKHYYTKKNQYFIELYAVCNSNKKFIYAITGYSGATHDTRVWSLTQIHQNPSRYFSSGEYLLGDSAYLPTKIIVPSYKETAKNNPQNKEFNRSLSSVRIDIEHSFGYT